MNQPQFPFDNQTWIISDTHFFHENIGRYCDRPDGWQDTIIDNWNRLIQPEEIVFHVGDLALGKREKIEGLVPLLNGRLYLMCGNHDRRSNGFYQRLGITLVPDPYRMDHPSGLKLIFSHRPILALEPGVLNLHGLSITIQLLSWDPGMLTCAWRSESIVRGGLAKF
jgi:calcineurin-like phosphoesterase family protein